VIRLGASACVAVVVVAAGHAARGRAPQGPPFAFGGSAVHGPYIVTVAADGSVHVRGGAGLMRIGATQLGSARIAALNRLALNVRFGSLPTVTHCSATPSNATPSWIRVGSKKVTVYGTCLPGYQRLLKALRAAVHLFSSG
jgi:hypothetical protein